MKWHKTSEELPEEGDECLCKRYWDKETQFCEHIVLVYKEYRTDIEFPWYNPSSDENFSQDFVEYWIRTDEIKKVLEKGE